MIAGEQPFYNSNQMTMFESIKKVKKLVTKASFKHNLIKDKDTLDIISKLLDNNVVLVSRSLQED